jgi:NDP-sugar pyrophosphorylase family protein
MKAMVLAAGEGTRLRPLTLALPKPMVPVANVPLLVRTLNLLSRQNVVDVAVNCFHRPDAIANALGDGTSLGLRTLRLSPEETLLGTAGGVRRVADFLDETFLVLYGDNLYHFDIGRLSRSTGKNGPWQRLRPLRRPIRRPAGWSSPTQTGA